MPELKLENSLVDNRYEVVERLSRGSFAEIFVARDRAAGGREVVIKALNTSLQGTPDADLERTLIENFQNEAVALDLVRHPHVILRWSHGTAADLRHTPFHYLSLEYMPGGDLLRLCRGRQRSSLSLDEALHYFKQVCEALAYAHEKGIIHRDLKPNNFLLSADQRTLKIADFGVAKMTTGEENEITRVGADVYAPPEHHPGMDGSGGASDGGSTVTGAAARSRLTASADIYSLAKSFYTIVCGRPPGQFRCDQITELPSDSILESARKPLLEVLRRATDNDPKARYASVVEFWSDLAQIGSNGDLKDQTLEGLDDTTVIRPRLNVAPGTMPSGPALPDFDQALVTNRLQINFNTATLVDNLSAAKPISEPAQLKSPPLKPQERSPKIFIELQDNRPAPVAQSPVKIEPQPTTPGDSKTPVKSTEPEIDQQAPKAKAERPIIRKRRKAAEKFNWKIRRNIFIGLIVFTFLGALVSVYNYVYTFADSRTGGVSLPFGFGQPTEIEIVSEGLKVHLEPSSSRDKDNVIGTVARSSRHEVIEMRNNWINIKVSEWSSKAGDMNLETGWIYGNFNGSTPYVRVVSRKFW